MKTKENMMVVLQMLGINMLITELLFLVDLKGTIYCCCHLTSTLRVFFNDAVVSSVFQILIHTSILSVKMLSFGVVFNLF